MNLIVQKIKIENKNDENQTALKKNIKFQKLLKLFNVYINLHLFFITKKYGTIINCNVLLNEIKHKYFVIFINFFKQSLI